MRETRGQRWRNLGESCTDSAASEAEKPQRMTSRKDTGDSGVAQTQTLRQFDMLDAASNRCHELTQRPITNGQAFKPELGQDSVNVRSHCIIPALADRPERPYECGGAVGVRKASPEQGNRNVIHSGTLVGLGPTGGNGLCFYFFTLGFFY